MCWVAQEVLLQFKVDTISTLFVQVVVRIVTLENDKNFVIHILLADNRGAWDTWGFSCEKCLLSHVPL